MEHIERDIRELMREEMMMHAPIKKILEAGPKTVPQIADALKRKSYEVMYWLMAMRKYGMVEEIGEADDDGYFQYKLKPEEQDD